MRKWTLIVAAILLPLPTATVAGPGASPTSAPGDVTVTGQRPDRDRIVCKSDVATGSIIPTQTCKTKGEWEELRQRGLAKLETMRKDEDIRRHVSDTYWNMRCENPRAC
jgi:hypothetical protein